MKKDKKTMMDERLRKPEPDEPLPDSVERAPESSFEADLSEGDDVEPLPDFAERVLDALAEMRARGEVPEPDDGPLDLDDHEAPVPSSAPAKDKERHLKPVPKAPASKKTPEDPPRVYLGHSPPPERRAAASRR